MRKGVSQNTVRKQINEESAEIISSGDPAHIGERLGSMTAVGQPNQQQVQTSTEVGRVYGKNIANLWFIVDGLQVSGIHDLREARE